MPEIVSVVWKPVYNREPVRDSYLHTTDCGRLHTQVYCDKLLWETLGVESLCENIGRRERTTKSETIHVRGELCVWRCENEWEAVWVWKTEQETCTHTCTHSAAAAGVCLGVLMATCPLKGMQAFLPLPSLLLLPLPKCVFQWLCLEDFSVLSAVPCLLQSWPHLGNCLPLCMC